MRRGWIKRRGIGADCVETMKSLGLVNDQTNEFQNDGMQKRYFRLTDGQREKGRERSNRMTRSSTKRERD